MSDARLDPGAEHQLRELAPRVLGALVRRCRDFAAAEDAVQEALIAATTSWPAQGLPENPGGWLFKVAWQRYSDQLSADEARRRRESAAAVREDDSRAADEPELDERMDDTLVLLFTCCHSSLTPSSAVALTLRAVGGLTTAEIASAFLVPEATMAQRIHRAKRTIQESGMPFELPNVAERASRLESVLRVLYLIFSEGYASSSGPELVRVELASEAIRLARALNRLQPRNPEVEGLLALMLLTDARRRARVGPRGELVPLDEQDRVQWDRAQIDEGTALISTAFTRGAVGAYQLQAAIAALHDAAASTSTTDWPQILALYEVLRRLGDNPMVELNRAIAFAMVHGARAGLELLGGLERDARIAGHHRLFATRAHFLELAGDREGAALSFRAAAERTASTAERNYLLTRAARLTHERDSAQD